MEAIRIDELSFAYPDGTEALRDLSLTIGEGESVGIVGANGAGKSTLVNHLNGYFLPQKGSVKIGEEALNRKTQEKIRRQVGVVFQNPDDQLFTVRLFDDVAFGVENLGMETDEVRVAVEGTLKELHLWELRDKPPSHLSHGQKRFAAFATILAMRPSVIVMDEPTSDLDSGNRRKLIRLVNGLKATRISASHDLDYIWDTCSRVLILFAGRLVADGETAAILSSRELLEKNGLELPLRLQR